MESPAHHKMGSLRSNEKPSRQKGASGRHTAAVRPRRTMPGSWTVALVGVAAGALCLTVGMLLGHFAIPKAETNTAPAWLAEYGRDFDSDVVGRLLSDIDTKRLEQNLKELSAKPHLASTAGDENLAKLILSRWSDGAEGLDHAELVPYDVLLSFPDEKNGNSVTVVNSSGVETYTARKQEEVVTADQEDSSIVPPYAAYSPPGRPKGKLVFANYGRAEDFEHLKSRNVNLTGTIAICKYGKAGRARKAINAESVGVVGLLVYTDPADINDGDVDNAYPKSWGLPRSGVERGSYFEDMGDPLTPYYPAKAYAFRKNDSEIKSFPPIPAQPIGYEDAELLMRKLAGEAAPADWKGALDCPYNIGPGFSAPEENSDVQINSFNKRVIKTSHNVIGVIRGSTEPDRYVLYGNHRDSWVHGAIDPSSGTSVMLEITRALGSIVKEGQWRPKRSIVFCSWGAEEFGLIGSVEWAEEYYKTLMERAVGYINVDISVFANATLRVRGTPPMQRVAMEAARNVKHPDLSGSHKSVYDVWLSHYNRTSPSLGVIPKLLEIGDGSDYGPFIHYLGVPCIDFSYTYDSSKSKARIYPAYHTGYDTFDYASTFIDPGFTSHQAVARTAAYTLLRLADSLLLPYNGMDYVETLLAMHATLASNHGQLLDAQGISLDDLKSAVEDLSKAAEDLNILISAVNPDTEPMKVRAINDQLMLLERAFTDPVAFPDKLYYRHVVWTPRSSAVEAFPGVVDAVGDILAGSGSWDRVRQHLAAATYAVQSAASTLRSAA
uniref:Aminopeptidase NAALADL1 n=1 Tax=Petromyzon marinus TaxID=7757 RepID=A0AAJ7SQU4_PETMA|nr:aminopeptidase NAALADL1 [Petromyzon marinus]